MTYTPEVGHLVRHHTSSPFRTVLFAGAIESCVSRRDDHRRPHVVWANASMIRVCPDCSQDWGDGDTCQHCDPPAPPWVPRRGDWAIDEQGRRVTVLTAFAGLNWVKVWDDTVGWARSRHIANLRPDPADPERSNQ